MIELGEHKGDGIRYAMHLSAPKGGSAQMLRDPDGGWVSWEDYARLKAEVERLTAEVSYDNRVQLHVDKLAAEFTQYEVERLKAEVEQLKEGNEYLGQMHDKEMERSAYLCEQVERLEKGIQPEGSNDAVGRAVNVLLEKEKEIARLKAEVESLYRNGDLMLKFASANMPYPAYATLAKDWLAVKEGKRS